MNDPDTQRPMIAGWRPAANLTLWQWLRMPLSRASKLIVGLVLYTFFFNEIATANHLPVIVVILGLLPFYSLSFLVAKVPASMLGRIPICDMPNEFHARHVYVKLFDVNGDQYAEDHGFLVLCSDWLIFEGVRTHFSLRRSDVKNYKCAAPRKVSKLPEPDFDKDRLTIDRNGIRTGIVMESIAKNDTDQYRATLNWWDTAQQTSDGLPTFPPTVCDPLKISTARLQCRLNLGLIALLAPAVFGTVWAIGALRLPEASPFGLPVAFALSTCLVLCVFAVIGAGNALARSKRLRKRESVIQSDTRLLGDARSIEPETEIHVIETPNRL